MKRLSTLAFLAVLSSFAAVPAGAQEPTGPNWRGWDEGLKEAAASRRPILVDVYTSWCGWCRVMDRQVYARDDVREYLSRRYVTIKLDAESAESAAYEGKSYTLRSLAARFRVTGYPTTIFLRTGGEHLVNVPGFVPADRFLLLLRYVGEGHFDRSVPFDSFVKSSGGSRAPAR